ncbi:HMG box [Ancylostoma caninum]|uniref:HMG box n=1 Tax=Ancylostoma caninum TaxID=29170 RepID=A0A368H4H6_ANCCA|nr:HMG box [Ancylostoma caninum]
MSTFRHPQATPSRNQTDFTMKAPKPPDRPLVPYMRYSRKMWSKVRAENPDAQLWDIGKIIGQMWRDISDADKAVYQHEYEIEKAEYEKAFKAYQNSHAYQQYINAKTRAKANEKSSRSRMEAGGVVIQPVDEEDAGNELSCRRLAAVRFDRNHRLIGDLFSPAIVTDTRTVVAQNRMDMLRKQAQSLSAHQNKLEEELVKYGLEEIHQEKKRQIEKGSEEFAENLKRVCEEKPQLDEAKYAELLEEMKTKLAEAYKEYKKKQDEINARLAAEREKIVEETPVLAELVMSEENDTDTVSKPPEKEETPAQPEEEEPPEKKKKEESEAENEEKPAEEAK